jgi:hypothetical protein
VEFRPTVGPWGQPVDGKGHAAHRLPPQLHRLPTVRRGSLRTQSINIRGIEGEKPRLTLRGLYRARDPVSRPKTHAMRRRTLAASARPTLRGLYRATDPVPPEAFVLWWLFQGVYTERRTQSHALRTVSGARILCGCWVLSFSSAVAGLIHCTCLGSVPKLLARAACSTLRPRSQDTRWNSDR